MLPEKMLNPQKHPAATVHFSAFDGIFFSDTAWASGFRDLVAVLVVKGRNMRESRVGNMLGGAAMMMARRATRRKRGRRMWRGGGAMVAALVGVVGVGWVDGGQVFGGILIGENGVWRRREGKRDLYEDLTYSYLSKSLKDVIAGAGTLDQSAWHWRRFS